MPTSLVDDVDATTAGAVMRKIRRHILLLLTACYVFSFINRVNLSFAAVPLSQSLSLSATLLGLSAGVFFIAYTLFEIPSNYILHRTGARPWLARIVVSWGVLAIGFTIIRSVQGFMILRFLLGAAEAGFVPGALYYITRWVPADHRASFIASWTVAVPLSVVFAAPVSGFILERMDGVGALHGWQWMFLIEGIPAIGFGLLLYFLLPETPKDAPWLSDTERAWLEAALKQEVTPTTERASFSAAFKEPRIVVIGIAGMALSMANYSAILWFALIAAGLKMSAVQAGLFTSFAYLIGCVGMILWARRSDRVGERLWHTVLPCFVGALTLGIAALYPQPAILAPLSFVVVLAIFCGTVVFWTLPTQIVGGEAAAAGFALINSIANLGGFFGPVLFGVAQDHFASQRIGFGMLGVGLLVGGLLLLATVHAARPSGKRPL